MADELDVTADFDANVGDFVSNLELAIDAAERFRDLIYEDVAAVEALHASLDDLPAEHLTNVSLVGEDEVLEQVAEIREYLGALPDEETIHVRMDTSGAPGLAAAAGLGAGAGDAAAATAAENALGDAEAGQAADAAEAAASTKALSAAQADVTLTALTASMSTKALSDSTAASNVAAAAATGFWARWGTVIHWVVAGGAEFLAVAIPGTVAMGTAMLASAEGATWLADKMEGVYTSTEATSGMLNKTAGEALGLKGALQEAQTAADPGVYEIFGAGLNIAKSSLYSFAGEGLSVVHIMDEFAARAVIDLGPGGPLGSQLQGLLGAGVKDFTEFGQILGNFGHFIVDFASEMPGLAEVLLGLIDDFTKLLVVLTEPAWWNFHGMLITIAMGIEEAWRWGGLLSNIFGSLATRAGGLATSLGGLSSGLSFFGGGSQRAAAQVEQANVALAQADQALINFQAMSREAAVSSEAFTVAENEQLATTLASTDAMLTMARSEALLAAVDAELAASEAEAAGATLTMSGALEGAGALLSGPWGWAIIGAAVGLGLLIHALADSKTAAQQFADTMEQAVDKANFSQGLTDILQDLPQLQQKYDAAAQAATLTGQAALKAGADVVVGGGRSAYVLTVAANAAATYQSAINQLVTQAVNVLSMNTRLGGSYYSLYTAMGLANAAGLTMGQAFTKQGQLTKIAVQQIDDMIAGYREMDQTGTTLANDINAVSVQAEMQQTKVSALNQAWDAFMSDVTGGTSALTSLYSDLTTIGNVTEVATSKITAFSQGNTGMNMSVKQVAESLKSFSGTSAQVWQNYNSSVTQAEQVTDYLRTAAAAGGVTNAQYTESIKGVIAQLLPYAQYSSTATAELDALAEQAGGPATTNYQTLAQWVGNTNEAQKTLNSTVSTATKYMSNLGNVAANLASTLDSAVDNAITAGTINIKGITTAAQAFTTALHTSNGVLNGETKSALSGFVTQLYDAGEPASDVVSIINQIMQRAGDSVPQIKAMDKEIQQLWADMQKIHNINATVSVNETVSSTVTGSGGGMHVTHNAAGTPSASPGWSWVGEAGPELVKFHGGETVVPNHAVGGYAGGAGWYDGGYMPGLAPILSGASGGSSGGGGGATAGAQPLHVHLMLDGREMAEAVLPDLVGAASRYQRRNSGSTTGLLKPS